MEYISKELCGFMRFKNAKRRKEKKNPNIPQLILRFVTKSENSRASPCCASPVTCPPFLHDAFQGYVTVSEINELYSQLGRDPKPVPNPSLANPSPEWEINPCLDGDSSKSATYEVCVAVQRELLPGCSSVFLLLHAVFLTQCPFSFFSKLCPSSSPASRSTSFFSILNPRPLPKTVSVHWPENMVSYRDPSPLPDSPPPPLPVKKRCHRHRQVTCVCVSPLKATVYLSFWCKLWGFFWPFNGYLGI